MKSGAFEFLTKPYRHQEFLDAIQQALQRDQQSRRQRKRGRIAGKGTKA
jgi:FixJ family two-component response regulator